LRLHWHQSTHPGTLPTSAAVAVHLRAKDRSEGSDRLFARDQETVLSAALMV